MRDADVILEIPVPWFQNPDDGERHRCLFASILTALTRLSVTIRPVELPFGADEAERHYEHGQLVISFHSRGTSGNILRVKESYIPPYYTIDRLGFSGFSELAKEPEKFLPEIEVFPLEVAEKLIKEIKQMVVQDNLSKYPQPISSEENFPEDYIFIPLQTVEDPVAELSFLDQFDVAWATADFANSIGKSVLVKRHPLCQSSHVAAFLDRFTTNFSNVQVVNGSIHQLIRNSSCVMGCNSGVLFEALIHGAHVVSFGRSDFQIATSSIDQIDEIPGAILGINGTDKYFQRRFIGWYLRSYCIHAEDIEVIQSRIGEALAEIDVFPIDDNDERKKLFEIYSRAENIRRQNILSGK